jgi:hypoxanthine phosphoribosyltransferase
VKIPPIFAFSIGEMMKLKDLELEKFITEDEINNKLRALGEMIDHDYTSKTPVFLPILNGSFMFSADLLKHITIPCRLSFVKISSYVGNVSSGQIKTLIGLEESLFNQDIIIVEDIIDTGLTLQKIVEELKSLGTKSVEVISLLRKKPARDKGIAVKYVGFEIESEFVVGYGLDYDGLGRNLRDIYKADAQNLVIPESQV